jgi:arylsulfatase A-like enzyme
MGGRPSPRRHARNLEFALANAAAVVAVWGAVLVAESVVLGLVWRDLFSGPWEVALARHTVVPMALAALSPLSLVVVVLAGVAAEAARGGRTAARVLALVAGLAAGALAMGVSEGRHFASWAVRAPFVLVLTATGALVGARGIPRIATLASKPVLLAALGFCIAVSSWLADGHVLSRLYPAFHVAMLIGSLLGSALVGMAMRAGAESLRVARSLTALAAVASLSCAAWTPHAVRALDRTNNLRLALVEHAPLLGRAIVVAAWFHRPAADVTEVDSVSPGEVARSVDWTGHDLVLLTVDALRADHVSSYGYSRPTTPNIDALAREGILFENAYCPTPHTSYSVTSLMTGKYLKPLLALGVGEESETWPQALRRYGWRTAAFYPPAVFFIDEDRFRRFELDHLGFEYAKVEFATPALRARQVDEYLEGAPANVPLFLWVHFFEPHEPYVVHPNHVFSGGASADVDAYDSEVAEADEGIGAIVDSVRRRRPGAVVIVAADHGEEFGEHGGRYHGTTVYEEQVRVPLVVVGPAVPRGARAATVVQTIDLLPTVLSAFGIPRPARLRGRDLGPLLALDPPKADGGFAFAETNDYALVASGGDRLVCERRAAACAMYRPKNDPLERHDVSVEDPARFDALRAMLRAVERDHGRYESTEGTTWPEALRRGLQGEADSALDVASLLDDADVAIRRKAAEITFRLQVPSTIPAAARALASDEDDTVRRWAALALARMGEPIAPIVELLLRDSSRDWRRSAALALAERGQARACDEIAAWWEDIVAPLGRTRVDGEPPRLALDLGHTEELLAATGKARCRTAVPALVRALDDVRARPHVADTLASIGDPRARARLLTLFATEPYWTARPHEARALLALGAADWSGASGAASAHVEALLTAPARASRLVVLVSDENASLETRIDGMPLAGSPLGAEVRALELPAQRRSRFHVELLASGGEVVGVWLVPAE